MNELRGARELHARLRALENVGLPMTQALGLATVAGAKKRVAVKTGVTRRTIRLAHFDTRSATVSVGAAGPFLEKGTRAHLIRPRRAKVLRFPTSGTSTTLGGRVRTGQARKLGNAAYVFARAVRHPGTKPKPFLLPAARDAVAHAGLKDVVIKAWNAAA